MLTKEQVGEITYDILRAAIITAVKSIIAVCVVFGLTITDAQTVALIVAGDSVMTVLFLVHRILKTLKASIPAQVQLVDAAGDDVGITTTKPRATRSSRKQE